MIEHIVMIVRSTIYGLIGMATLLAVYFSVLSLISGWPYAIDQFGHFWYFIVSLAIGFGIQIGLYVYLKNLIRGGYGSGKVLGVTGTTSTAAMLSCCTHYIINLLPILGVAGVVTFIAQYQVQLFWVGLLFNLGGIVYMVSRIIKYKRA
ncbi:MAG: hypothetical protein Q7S62_02060 [bacterium]|nr:hypothetical protein [bacterium]